MQQSPQMINIPPLFAQKTITTEQIQKLLEENKRLILAILENQNLGKLAECAEYQNQLQKNLMYLAAVADAQPTAPTGPPQVPPQTAVQQGQYMQHPPAVTVQQQVGGFASKVPFQLNPQDQQLQQLPSQPQHPMQGHLSMKPGVANAMHQIMQSGLGMSGNVMDARGNRQESSEPGSGDAHGRVGPGHGGGDS